MKKLFLAAAIMVLCTSHTMFLKFDTYFLEPNTSTALYLYNGTFDKSENVIDRNRMLDASILGSGKRVKVAESQWTEKDSITILNFQTGEAGTYVAGVSTKARSLEMSAADFNEYLKHEGINDMLTWRKNNDVLHSKAVEKYSKHVKTIFQVGNTKTDDWQTALGYPIEFIPLTNPYNLHTGDSLQVKLLYNGQPLANQLVYADYKAPENGHTHDAVETQEEHGHSHDEDEKAEEHGHSHDAEKSETTAKHSHDGSEPHSHDNKESAVTKKHSHDDGSEAHSHETKESEELHTHTSGQKLRTNSEGIVNAHLSADGVWYFQTINLVNTKEEGLTHESNWATLTFELVHGHGEDTHTHEDEHEHEPNYKMYIFLIGSFLLIGILFLWFNRKNNNDEK